KAQAEGPVDWHLECPFRVTPPVYNRAKPASQDAPMLTARRFPRHLRPIAIIAILLCLCAWATFPRASARQSQAGARAFPASAWAATAHGDAAQAECLAKAAP